MRYFLILGIFFSANFLVAQELKGSVKTSEPNGHTIPFAHINFVDLGINILADTNGFWQLNGVNEGVYRIEISAYGYGSELFEAELSNVRTTFYLSENHRELDKLIITHHGVLQNQSITAIETLPLKGIHSIPTTTLGESLSAIPGVYQTGIGLGVSKPVIRGLSGSSVVTYVNSLRVENQQWGGDHGLPITSLGIGSVEVIKGPASLLYGADALGGVLYFVDEPYVSQQTRQLFFESKFNSMTLGTSNEAGYKMSTKKIRFNLYGAYDNHADYQLPNKNYVLNSRFNQSAAKAAIGYSKKNWIVNLRYNFYHGRIGLPGHTHEVDVTPLSFQTAFQNRGENVPAQSITNHFFALEQKLLMKRHELHLTIGHTRNGLKEFEEKFFTPDIVLQLNNTLYNAKWRYKLTENLDFFLGSQGMSQNNRNSPLAPERLIPDANTTDLGVFGLITYRKNTWRFQLGGRFDNRTISTQDEEIIPPLLKRYQGYNYSAGLARIAKKSSIRLNISSGFRAPTSSELLSDGIHHGAFRYEKGNLNLQTEKAVQIDVSYGFHFDDLEIVINPFYNRIRDYIYLLNTGELAEDLPLFQYEQANFAQLYGTDFGFHYHPHNAHWLHIESSFSSIFAEDDEKNPLPLIPQTRINNQVRIDFEGERKIQFKNILIQYLYLFKQNRLGVLETSSPDYHMINLGLTVMINTPNPIVLIGGVRNLLNTTYIDHLSGLKQIGISNPGINFYIGFKVELNNNLKTK